jgi:hypothetical protein
MRYVSLWLGALMIFIFLSGCAKKPVPYTPKNAAETAIMNFCQQQNPDLVIISITQQTIPALPAASAASTKAMQHAPLPYHVELATAKDASKVSRAMVLYNEELGKVDEKSFIPQ